MFYLQNIFPNFKWFAVESCASIRIRPVSNAHERAGPLTPLGHVNWKATVGDFSCWAGIYTAKCYRTVQGIRWPSVFRSQIRGRASTAFNFLVFSFSNSADGSMGVFHNLRGAADCSRCRATRHFRLARAFRACVRSRVSWALLAAAANPAKVSRTFAANSSAISIAFVRGCRLWSLISISQETLRSTQTMSIALEPSATL